MGGVFHCPYFDLQIYEQYFNCSSLIHNFTSNFLYLSLIILMMRPPLRSTFL